MSEHLGLYPWGGRFVVGDSSSPVAVVTLSEEFELPSDKVALYGSMKTENLGVEKVVANVISNPNIRFLIVCGTEVRGHRSGDSLLNLHKSGIDGNNRVIGAKSAIPFIENLPKEALERFQRQVKVVDLVDVADKERIIMEIERAHEENPGPFGEPFITPLVSRENVVEVFHTEFALHSRIDMDLYGVVSGAPGGA